MKKTLLISAILSLAAAQVFAQGQITFSTGTSLLIKFSTDGITATAYPQAGVTPFGTANVGFFAAPSGTALSLSGGLPNFTSSWTALTTVVPVGTLGAGTAVAGDLVLPSALGAPGVNVEFEVVAWTGTDTTWGAAVNDNSSTELLGFSGDTFNSSTEGGLGWVQGTSSGAPPAVVATGTASYNGIVVRSHTVNTPEPSAYLLGGVAAVVLMLSRLLKNRSAKPVAR